MDRIRGLDVLPRSWCAISELSDRTTRSGLTAYQLCHQSINSARPTMIAALRSEKAELEAGMADLTRRVGRIILITCGGRICIDASNNQGNDAAGNPAPMGS